jgi:hypothetical protein
MNFRIGTSGVSWSHEKHLHVFISAGCWMVGKLEFLVLLATGGAGARVGN